MATIRTLPPYIGFEIVTFTLSTTPRNSTSIMAEDRKLHTLVVGTGGVSTMTCVALEKSGRDSHSRAQVQLQASQSPQLRNRLV